MAVADSTAALPPEVEGKCNVRTKRGTRCGQPAGKGTQHSGRGPCKLHGGMLPGVVAKYERQAAFEALVPFGGAIEVGPIDALLQCVYRASGIAAWLRAKVESLEDPDPGSPWIRLEGEWVDKLARFSKMALDAGVAERQVRIAERTGQRIAAALEEAVGPLDLSADDRVAVVERFVTRLAVLEQTDDE